MRRPSLLLLLLLALVGCGRRVPVPTSSPTATLPQPTAPVPSFTARPQASPLPRITVVPSATRLPPTVTPTPEPVTPVPTSTPLPSPTATPVPTPTQATISAGPTNTPSPTASATEPLPESPLPTPTQATSTPAPSAADEPSPMPTGTPVANAGATATATLETPGVASATPTPTATLETPGAASATPTQTTEPQGEAWSLEGILTYFDEAFSELYLWGAVVNQSDAYRRLTTLMPVVYDAQGQPVTSEEDVGYASGYDELVAALSLAPGQSLAFSFVVMLPENFAYRDDYEIVVEGTPAESPRDDLHITQRDPDDGDWPYFYYVDGMYENPGSDLSEYLAVVATLYDADGRVIGVGWQYETNPYFLGAGEKPFDIAVDIRDVIPDMELEVNTYEVQIFGN